MYAILGLCYTALTSAAPRRTWETDDLELLMQCSQSQEDPVDFALEIFVSSHFFGFWYILVLNSVMNRIHRKTWATDCREW